MATVYRDLAPEDAQLAFTTSAYYRRVNGTNMPVSSLGFIDSATRATYWRLALPDYGSGNITLRILWYADTATSGVIYLDATMAAITPDTDSQDVETDTFPTAISTTDTHLGTTGQRLHQCTIVLTGATLDSVAAGDVVTIRLQRQPTQASDTLTGEVLVEMVTMSYSNT